MIFSKKIKAFVENELEIVKLCKNGSSILSPPVILWDPRSQIHALSLALSSEISANSTPWSLASEIPLWSGKLKWAATVCFMSLRRMADL